MAAERAVNSRSVLLATMFIRLERFHYLGYGNQLAAARQSRSLLHLVLMPWTCLDRLKPHPVKRPSLRGPIFYSLLASVRASMLPNLRTTRRSPNQILTLSRLSY